MPTPRPTIVAIVGALVETSVVPARMVTPSDPARADDGAYVVVEGFHFRSPGQIKMNNCDHCRVSRFRVERAMAGGEIDWITVGGTSKYCRIDHNDFGPLTQRVQERYTVHAHFRDAGGVFTNQEVTYRGVTVGHAAFSPVRIDGRDRGWFGLGPVAAARFNVLNIA